MARSVWKGTIGFGLVSVPVKAYPAVRDHDVHFHRIDPAVRPLDGALAMSTMRFADEVVPRKDVDEVPSRRSKPDAKMLRMPTQLVDALTGDWLEASIEESRGERRGRGKRKGSASGRRRPRRSGDRERKSA